MKRFIAIIISISSLLAVGLIYFGASAPKTAPSAPKGEKAAELHSSQPGDRDFYDTVYSFAGKYEFDVASGAVAGIAPHHLLAGDMIAGFYRNLEQNDYDTVVLVGPNHFLAGDANVITSLYDWQTPYGVLECDRELLYEIEQAYGGIGIEPSVIDAEHAVTSHAAFIKRSFPSARFLPLVLNPNLKPEEANRLAETVAEKSQGKKILLVSSTDFSHYTDSRTAQEQDKASLAVLNDMELAAVEAMKVDSTEATRVVMEYARLKGARFQMLANSNSAILSGKEELGETTSYISGYFSPENSGTRMLFLGDLMLDRYVGDMVGKNGFGYLMKDLADSPFFSGFDLMSANLEGAVTDQGEHYRPEKAFDFAFSPQDVAKLKNYGFNYFTLANNHFADQGDRGMQETRHNLDELGFMYSGSYNGMVDTCSLSTVEIKGRRVSLLAYSAVGVNIKKEKVFAQVEAAASTSDLVIVNMHWGEEYQKTANQAQRDLAHGLVDAGADAIVGHHPHVIEGVEVYKNKPIFYSLGNFIFDQYFSADTQKGLALGLTFAMDGLEIDLIPLVSTMSSVRQADEAEAEATLEEVAVNSDVNEAQRAEVKKGKIFLKDKTYAGL